MKIDRTLFWFKDENNMLTFLNEDFFGLSNLLNRLLNEKYDGKKIKFINIFFSTKKIYESNVYYYGGHLHYRAVFDKDKFINLSKSEQYKFVWEKAHKYLLESANFIKNSSLAEAADYAYSKGLEMNLNPDYRVVDTDIIIFGEHLRASVWINFKEDGMSSEFTLERSGNVIFKKELDKTVKGVEFFLVMYKAIVVEGNNIVIKGRRDVEDLPLKIPFSEIFG